MIGVCETPEEAGGKVVAGGRGVVGFDKKKAGLSSAARTRDFRCVGGGGGVGSDMAVVVVGGGEEEGRKVGRENEEIREEKAD